jgi:hypothetical protein
VSLFGSKVRSAPSRLTRRRALRRKRGAAPRRPALAAARALSGDGSFDALARTRTASCGPAHRPATFLGKRVVTDDGKVHLAPPDPDEEAEKLDDDFARELRDEAAAEADHQARRHDPQLVDPQPRRLRRGTIKLTNYLYVHPERRPRAG